MGPPWLERRSQRRLYYPLNLVWRGSTEFIFCFFGYTSNIDSLSGETRAAYQDLGLTREGYS